MYISRFVNCQVECLWIVTICLETDAQLPSKSQNRTKIGSPYSLWEEIVSGVPQGSILGPLLFNIFLCDLFLSIENNYFTNYADDTTPYVIGNNPDKVVSELKDITEKLFTWISQN